MLRNITQRIFNSSHGKQDVNEPIPDKPLNEGLDAVCKHVPSPYNRFKTKEHFKKMAQSLDVLETLPRCHAGKVLTSADYVVLDAEASDKVAKNIEQYFTHEDWKTAEDALQVWGSSLIPAELRKIRFSGETLVGTTPASVFRHAVSALGQEIAKRKTIPQSSNVVEMFPETNEADSSKAQEHPASNTALTAEIQSMMPL